MRVKTIGTTILGVLALVLASNGVAGANFATDLSGNCNFSTQANCVTEDRLFSWDADLGPQLTAATFDSLYNSFDTTVLNVGLQGTANDNTHDGHVDVWYHTGSVAAGIAISSCQDWIGHVCDHWHVIYDGADLAGGSASYLKSTACHETGHTVGLQHPSVNNHGLGNESREFRCMSEAGYFYDHLGTINADHINNYY